MSDITEADNAIIILTIAETCIVHQSSVHMIQVQTAGRHLMSGVIFEYYVTVKARSEADEMQKNMEMVSDDTFIQTLQRNGGTKFTSVRRDYLVKVLGTGKSSDPRYAVNGKNEKSAVMSIHMQIGLFIIAGVALTMLVLFILKMC